MIHDYHACCSGHFIYKRTTHNRWDYLTVCRILMKGMSRLSGWALVVLSVATKIAHGDFAYGVNAPETGDVKAHRQITTADGRIEGEYRWLQPNGLYRVTRYYIDENGGYRAFVSEEAGVPVDNFYTNTFHGYPGAFIPSQSGDHLQPDNSIQRFIDSPNNIVQKQLYNNQPGNVFQDRAYSRNIDSDIHSDVTIVGENTLLSNPFG